MSDESGEGAAMNKSPSPAGEHRRQTVMRYIDSYWTENHCSPSMREIGANCGKMAVSHVKKALEQLAERGMICELRPGRNGYIPTWVRDALDMAGTEEYRAWIARRGARG